jgi:hypothetical protein
MRVEPVVAGVGFGLAPMLWRSGSRRPADENLQTSETTVITLPDLNPDGLRAASMISRSPIGTSALHLADIKSQ